MAAGREARVALWAAAGGSAARVELAAERRTRLARRERKACRRLIGQARRRCRDDRGRLSNGEVDVGPVVPDAAGILIGGVGIPGSQRIGAGEGARRGERQGGARLDRLPGEARSQGVVRAPGIGSPRRARGDCNGLNDDRARAGVLVGHGAVQRVAHGHGRQVEHQR